MARPEFQVTEKDQKTVKTMSALGFKHDDISNLLGIAPKTLRKHFRVELDHGAIEANQKVMQSLFNMAASGKNTAASIFWAKTRCGLRERTEDGEPGTQPGTQTLVVKVE